MDYAAQAGMIAAMRGLGAGPGRNWRQATARKGYAHILPHMLWHVKRQIIRHESDRAAYVTPGWASACTE